MDDRYIDLLVGEYKYLEKNIEIVNTLDNLNNHTNENILEGN